MAIYRTVQLSFWTDNLVEDEFTPEDKYFYLYLLTNPQTNICGCYEVSWKQLTGQTGYNRDSIERLLDRFENHYGLIKFNATNKEILILNWAKHNWSKSEKVLKGVSNMAQYIKTKDFRKYVMEMVVDMSNGTIQPEENGYPMDTLCIPYTYPMDTSVYITNTITNIVNYLNNKLDSNYKPNSKNTIKHIKARLDEGFTEEDFYSVIDYKVSQWGNDNKMRDYLRPDTLFGTKFESYLQNAPKKKSEPVKPEPIEEESVDYGWEDDDEI